MSSPLTGCHGESWQDGWVRSCCLRRETSSLFCTVNHTKWFFFDPGHIVVPFCWSLSCSHMFKSTAAIAGLSDVEHLETRDPSAICSGKTNSCVTRAGISLVHRFSGWFRRGSVNSPFKMRRGPLSVKKGNTWRKPSLPALWVCHFYFNKCTICIFFTFLCFVFPFLGFNTSIKLTAWFVSVLVTQQFCYQ